ncbi:tail fiber assembly protein [Salmonella enterica]
MTETVMDALLIGRRATVVERIAQARAYINAQLWPSRLLLARITPHEREQFNLWLDYIDELNGLDLTEPFIVWPVAPAKEGI